MPAVSFSQLGNITIYGMGGKTFTAVVVTSVCFIFSRIIPGVIMHGKFTLRKNNPVYQQLIVY